MLRDRYDPLNLFKLVSALGLETDRVLAHLDMLLDDDQFFQLVRADLSRRCPRTLNDGRRFRVRTIVDNGSRVSPAIAVDFSCKKGPGGGRAGTAEGDDCGGCRTGTGDAWITGSWVISGHAFAAHSGRFVRFRPVLEVGRMSRTSAADQ